MAANPGEVVRREELYSLLVGFLKLVENRYSIKTSPCIPPLNTYPKDDVLYYWYTLSSTIIATWFTPARKRIQPLCLSNTWTDNKNVVYLQILLEVKFQIYKKKERNKEGRKLSGQWRELERIIIEWGDRDLERQMPNVLSHVRILALKR